MVSHVWGSRGGEGKEGKGGEEVERGGKEKGEWRVERGEGGGVRVLLGEGREVEQDEKTPKAPKTSKTPKTQKTHKTPRTTTKTTKKLRTPFPGRVRRVMRLSGIKWVGLVVSL